MSTSPSLRERLAAGRAVTGLWTQLPGVVTAELVAGTGADFVVLDLQHGGLAEAELPGVAAAVVAAGSVPLVRTRSTAPADVGRPLDLGAHGVVVPGVRGADHARSVVAACRYAPAGTRSAGRLSGGTDDPLVVLMVETAGALEELDALLAVDGLDGVYVGPLDLSLALGRPREGVRDVLSGVIARAVAAGIPVGVHAVDGATAAGYAAEGATIVTAAMDNAVLTTALTDHLRVARSTPG